MITFENTDDRRTRVFYTSEKYSRYMNHQGYRKVEVVSYDTSKLEKGYLTLYIYDLDKEEVYQTNMMLQAQSSLNHPLPLEQLIEVFIQQEYEELVNCLHVEFEQLIGVQCQILVERQNNYFNITKVFPMDTVLPEYTKRSVFDAKNAKPFSGFSRYENVNDISIGSLGK